MKENRLKGLPVFLFVFLPRGFWRAFKRPNLLGQWTSPGLRNCRR